MNSTRFHFKAVILNKLFSGGESLHPVKMKENYLRKCASFCNNCNIMFSLCVSSDLGWEVTMASQAPLQCTMDLFL